MTGAVAEFIDVVDAWDNVVGMVPRHELRRDPALNFRVAHVFVFDRRGRLLLQRLAPAKATSFSWGSSVAGHVKSGESYEQAARREFLEELGVAPPPLDEVGKEWIDELQRRKFIGVFRAQHDGPFAPEAAEVGSVEFVPVADVRRWLLSGARTFSPTFERVFRCFENSGGWPPEW